LKNDCERLTHLHKMVYTWWCWYFAKEAVLELIMLNLEKSERFFGVLWTLGWLLKWNTALICCELDQVLLWVV
jgi:hypothetical protein